MDRVSEREKTEGKISLLPENSVKDESCQSPPSRVISAMCFGKTDPEGTPWGRVTTRAAWAAPLNVRVPSVNTAHTPLLYYRDALGQVAG